MKTVLVVDDDRVILNTLVAFLSSYSEDLELLTAENGRQAMEVLGREPVDLLLTDLYMPEMDGFELLAHMVRDFSSVPIIVMSGYEVPEMGDELVRQGALHYLEKPFDVQTLADTVRQTLARTSKGHLTGSRSSSTGRCCRPRVPSAWPWWTSSRPRSWGFAATSTGPTSPSGRRPPRPRFAGGSSSRTASR